LRAEAVLSATALLIGLMVPGLAAGDDVILRAMNDELARSMKSLQMGELSKPYFISYRVDDVAELETAASFGSLLSSDLRRVRRLTVELRVGDRSLDNTNFLSMPDFGGGALLPLEDDYQELRRKLWLATDAAYKQALEDLSKKRATLQNKTRTDEIPDFSEERPATTVDETPAPSLPDVAAADSLVRDLSRLFRDMPEVYLSSVRLRASTLVTRIVTSEGTRVIRTTPEVRLAATASTQADDGMPLQDFVAAYGRTFADLPARDELARQIVDMGQRLTELRRAPLLETYNGPVLVEGQAAAEVLVQALVPRLLAARVPVADNPQLEMFMQAQQESSFVDKIGARVLPRFLDLVDDPTLTELDGSPLLGGYSADDDGVPARATTLVQRGVLKTLLATRTPVRGITSSTGNRRGASAAPSNLLVSPSQGMPPEALRQELLALVAERELPFGVIVRRIGNPMLGKDDDPWASIMSLMSPRGGEAAVQPVVAAFKVYPDGREELVRDVLFGDVGADSFKDIVAVSEGRGVHTMPLAASGPSLMTMVFAIWGGPGNDAPLVSVVTPSLLFEDLTLKKPSGEIPKPPVAPHPAFAAAR